ncbi:HEAT repeat domain-containing protein [Streptomyces sp. NPDC059566]
MSPYAVTAFAECARREDAPVLRALLEHPAGQVRAAAVGGLRLLDTTDLELLRPLLDDPSPAVAREAARSLSGSAARLPADWLMARIAPERPPHTRRAAYRVLFARGGIAGLRASVQVLTDPDPALRTIAAQRIQSMWSPYRPPDLPSGDPEVGALLDRCTHLFSDHVMRRMRSRLAVPSGPAPVDGS